MNALKYYNRLDRGEKALWLLAFGFFLYGLFAFIDDVSAAGQQWILFFIVGVAFFGAHEVKKKNNPAKVVEAKEE
ncbi:MAG: hypothetical protein CBB95_17255 [Alteromonas sp. TMED35]|nr:MAG: hypothetical protein CBB95_17255 [Alteromonas sp. TMED35]|tara:strand:+ start:3960 stop:4184 length:225 start_codon:yes stop_codon:yes gene_type:complete